MYIHTAPVTYVHTQAKFQEQARALRDPNGCCKGCESVGRRVRRCAQPGTWVPGAGRMSSKKLVSLISLIGRVNRANSLDRAKRPSRSVDLIDLIEQLQGEVTKEQNDTGWG